MRDVAGVRAEESPARMMGLTSYATYKWMTFGLKEDPRQPQYTFYPIYDWSYTDVWKAIHDNGWPYCKIYDLMYQHGIPIREMRVSNLHHETAIKILFYLQEVEPETWERLTARLAGVNSAAHMQKDFNRVTELPFMFKDWWEYRDYLLENLVRDEAIKETMRHQFKRAEGMFLPEAQLDLVHVTISCILSTDFYLSKLTTFTATHGKLLKGAGKHKDKYT
jgi:predicted phosphoadenosine phosphosulfate sulfurtransferase